MGGGRPRAVPEEKKVSLEEMNSKEIWSMVFKTGVEVVKTEVNKAYEGTEDNHEAFEEEKNDNYEAENHVVLIHMEPLPKVVPVAT